MLLDHRKVLVCRTQKGVSRVSPPRFDRPSDQGDR
jgi:hypothetical protein